MLAIVLGTEACYSMKKLKSPSLENLHSNQEQEQEKEAESKQVKSTCKMAISTLKKKIKQGRVQEVRREWVSNKVTLTNAISKYLHLFLSFILKGESGRGEGT